MLELVEMEMRETLTEYGYDGDNTPIVVVCHHSLVHLSSCCRASTLTAVSSWLLMNQRMHMSSCCRASKLSAASGCC
jgi:translation elongation factor EF-Tu-like GTPase